MEDIKKLSEFLNEEIDTEQGEYKSLKRGILDLLGETDELVDTQNQINDYIEDPENVVIEEFIEDNEIYDFYLKYRGDVDEILLDKEYFDEIPKENDIFSLYDFVIEGTKIAFLECLKIIQEENF